MGVKEVVEKLKPSKGFMGGVFILGFIILGSLTGQLFETNNKGQFQVKQAAMTGTMSVKTKPGMYGQLFGDITTWDKADTFYFTADAVEGAKHDQSMEVRFVDGSLCNISGTMRISLPMTESEILHLVEDLNFTSYDALEAKLIMPTVRNALRLTANFMTARESYAEKRADFNTWAWDQIQNGLYKTKDIEREVIDPTTGKKTTKTFKTILRDKNGTPIYTKNPLAGTGIRLSNFEVKSYVYSRTVVTQIEEQQKLYMAIATAKAQGALAQQDKIKEDAEGLTREAKARADANVLKMTEVVEAEKLKAVAVLNAERKYEVEKLAAREALERAKKIRAEGAAKAAANLALVKAGLTPLKRAQIDKETAIGVAQALASVKLPTSMIIGGGSSTSGGNSAMTAIGYEAMSKLVKNMSKQK